MGQAGERIPRPANILFHSTLDEVWGVKGTVYSFVLDAGRAVPSVPSRDVR